MKKSLFLLLVLFLGCKKDPVAKFAPDYVIFGTSYGECGGDCARLFKLENQNLYPDDGIEYLMQNGGDIPFMTQSLPADKVALAESLKNQIPASLLDEPEEVLGCPDCRDQGTVYIETKTGDQVSRWYIDPDLDQYASFCDSVRVAVLKLQ